MNLKALPLEKELMEDIGETSDKRKVEAKSAKCPIHIKDTIREQGNSSI